MTYQRSRAWKFILLFCSYTIISLFSNEISCAHLPIPRFVSIRTAEANVRVGPGKQYPIQWVLVRQHLPLEIIAEFDTWRKIKDPEGEVGWVHQSLLAGMRTAIVQGSPQTMHHKPTSESFAVAHVEPGVMVKVLKCRNSWCRVQVQTVDGWIDHRHLWGVYEGEEVK